MVVFFPENDVVVVFYEVITLVQIFDSEKEALEFFKSAGIKATKVPNRVEATKLIQTTEKEPPHVNTRNRLRSTWGYGSPRR